MFAGLGSDEAIIDIVGSLSFEIELRFSVGRGCTIIPLSTILSAVSVRGCFNIVFGRFDDPQGERKAGYTRGCEVV